MLTKDFVLAGKATFTVDNGKGNWYTYKVTHKKANGRFGDAYFVKLLTGPDNTRDYTYIGMLNSETGVVSLTGKSQMTPDTQPYRVLNWALQLLWHNAPWPAGYEIHHEGRCGRCGRKLTVPESIKTGIGPECAGRMAIAPNRSAA